VATDKPLKLRRESYSENVALLPAENIPVASVLVQVPSSLIPDIWDYLVPQELDSDCQVGSLVRLPFRGSILEGIILSRRELGEESGLKYLHSTLSRIPVLTPGQIEQLPTIAARYGCSQSAIVESFYPPFSKSGEKAVEMPAQKVSNTGSPFRQLRIIASNSTLFQEILEILEKSPLGGKKVFIFPELHELEAVQSFLEHQGFQPLILHSGLSKSTRYRNYLLANYLNEGVILALRSGAFLHGDTTDLFVVIDDVESKHYEGRSPSWNTRDVLLMRSSQTNILFLSHAPSLETARLVDRGWLPYAETSAPRKKIIAQERNPENSTHGVISQGLKTGSVLIIHNTKGYINAFSCSQCRNMALCDCGGKLTLTSLTETPICSTCTQPYMSWKCRWCGTMKPRMAQKGINVSAREMAASFPGVSVLISTADHRISELPQERSLILATVSCEPRGEYSAIIYLSADRDFASPHMRSQERTRNHWAKLLTLLAADGTLFLEMPSNHSAVQDLIKGKPLDSARKEIIERDELHLPPNYRIIAIFGQPVELQRILPILIKHKFSFVGPFQDSEARAKIVIKVSHESASTAIETLVSINRVQGAKDRPLFSIHVDPAEL